VLLADAHHDSLPYSMRELARALSAESDFQVREICRDYQKGSYLSIVKSMFAFMRAYANAGFVVICDNHLPVAACKKRPETKVIQLWHSGGALKRFGYDTTGNVPDSYHGGNVYANYDLIAVSADYAIEPFVRAMRTDQSKVQPLGISRTDWFFDEARKQEIRERFAREYPQAQGKRIILWAPTFRGSAGDPQLAGTKDIEEFRDALPDDTCLIVKLHPHARKKYQMGDAPMLAEELLVVADVLISDYSSIIYDYAYFGRPLILFTPDFEEYRRTCGFYEDYEKIPAYRANTGAELSDALALTRQFDPAPMREFWKRTMRACDGHATERVIRWMREQITMGENT
jgi:CDP-ribitol ribitolphosphotransferase